MKRTFAGMNAAFTNKVVAYLDRGYSFSTQTMRGSQGEVAKADVTDGTELIRVMMTEGLENGETEDGTYYFMTFLRLVVGRCKDDGVLASLNSKNSHYTVWNQDLEIISEEKWYEVRTEDGIRYALFAEALEACADKYRMK